MIPLLPHRMKCHNGFESGQFGRLCKSGEKTHDSLIIRKMLIGGEGRGAGSEHVQREFRVNMLCNVEEGAVR